MAFITLDSQKLAENYQRLDELFQEKNIQWAVVSKMLCGHRLYLEELIKLGAKQLCDSRLSNLKMIKSISEEVETIYIKPPPQEIIPEIVQYADISFNTEIESIRLLSEEAARQNKLHKVIIMIEMGELREGVMREEFMDFYEQVFKLPNIQVVGIGTNLTCMYGVLPSQDKLIQLCLYEQLVEAKFNREIPLVSGGSSVTIPLIFQNLLPEGINHFRVGETLYLGTDVYNNRTYERMHQDVFKLYAQIIELNEKPLVPDGNMGLNLKGEAVTFKDELRQKTAVRAIIDLGLLDVDEAHLQLADPKQKMLGASSDMVVIDLGSNEEGLGVGDLIEFKLDYMAILRIMNSKYIEKRLAPA
ncbi:alanine racemase [Saprospira grandis]|uniref:alanine racemase n=1 Tax=Saprospira grandis TaxID=1008 RepID=UPI0022DD03DE|nr:alanine racemase [Saprospira grandis]WBM75632.1 alanine racemase [Saprospira grandis]